MSWRWLRTEWHQHCRHWRRHSWARCHTSAWHCGYFHWCWQRDWCSSGHAHCHCPGHCCRRGHYRSCGALSPIPIPLWTCFWTRFSTHLHRWWWWCCWTHWLRWCRLCRSWSPSPRTTMRRDCQTAACRSTQRTRRSYLPSRRRRRSTCHLSWPVAKAMTTCCCCWRCCCWRCPC